MKSANVTLCICIDYGIEINEKDLNFTVCDHVRISKYKSIFAKGSAPIQLGKIFVIKKVKNTVHSAYVINDRNGKEIVATFQKSWKL